MNEPQETMTKPEAGQTFAATESETPRVSAALAATLESCGWLKREVHGPLVDLARELERENDSLRAAARKMWVAFARRTAREAHEDAPDAMIDLVRAWRELGEIVDPPNDQAVARGAD